MSFGSLKTIKLERTLGDAVLSITKQVPTDYDEQQAFTELDSSIIESAINLKEFTPKESTKAEVTTGYPVIDTTPEATPEKPKKRGRPAGSKAKKAKEVKETEVPPVIKEEVKPKLTKVKEVLATQESKTELLQKFQASFESEVGYESDETYEAEFNAFLTSLISMNYETYLESDITTSQLKTFEQLI